MNLRPYQNRVVDDVRVGWDEASAQLVVLPTGGGKTIVFSRIAKETADAGGRTLILAHREELIDQAIEKLYRSTGLLAAKEKAEHSASLQSMVVVASVQTMARRLEKWPADHFALVVVDEAHHAISPTYQTILKYFDGSANVLGVTATPDRGDKRSLGKYFERVASEVGLFDLINDGFLSRIIVKSIPLEIDIRGVKQSAGDYNEGELGDALAPYLSGIARAIQEHASFRRTLVFLPLRATSRAFVEECERAGLAAKHIDGDSPDRREILQSFAAGEFDVLSNAMLLTEGFDDPGIDCVVVLRPTRSRSLYAQMVGRGTRVHECKEDLLLLDFLWMHETHVLVRPASLVSSCDDEAEQITLKLQKTGGGDDLEDAASIVREEREEKLRRELAEKAKRRAKFINPAEFALLMGSMETAEFEPTTRWDEKPLTPGQRNLLERNGFELAEIRGRGHASKVIELITTRIKMGLCSPKQMRLLKQWGIADAEKVSFTSARAIIDARLNRGKAVAV